MYVLYVCMYVYVYVCICVYMYVSSLYIHTYIHIYITWHDLGIMNPTRLPHKHFVGIHTCISSQVWNENPHAGGHSTPTQPIVATSVARHTQPHNPSNI